VKTLPVEIIFVSRPASKPESENPLLPVLARMGAKIRRKQQREKGVKP